jgi:hypothetical protein
LADTGITGTQLNDSRTTSTRRPIDVHERVRDQSSVMRCVVGAVTLTIR